MDTIALGDRHSLLVDAFVEHGDCHLFNTPAFFRLHAAGRRAHYFQMTERANGLPQATVHFTETDPGRFRSPARGTFGGISARAGFTLEQLEVFLRAVELFLRERGARALEVALPPASHDLPGFSTSFNVLARLGYGVFQQELNYDIAVGAEPLAQRMEHGNRKRLNKCLREGYAAAALGPERYQAAYELIAGNRRRKGYPVTMTFSEISKMTELFGERVRFFGVERAGELAAASVCIALDRKVLYVLYWGDAEGMQEHSPVVQLAAAIYEHCQKEGFGIMDAGISTDKGEPNHGLIRFKRSLDMRESVKLTLSKITNA